MSPDKVDRLPAHPAPARQPSPPIRKPVRARSLRVLLIEDDPTDTALILDVLRRQPYVACARATGSPAFALRQLAAGRLRSDLVLLDVRVRRLDGFAFIEKMRQIPAMASVPVVLFTGAIGAADLAEVERSSAALCLAKPTTYLDLQSCLNGVVRRASSNRWSQ